MLYYITNLDYIAKLDYSRVYYIVLYYTTNLDDITNLE